MNPAKIMALQSSLHPSYASFRQGKIHLTIRTVEWDSIVMKNNNWEELTNTNARL